MYYRRHIKNGTIERRSVDFLDNPEWEKISESEYMALLSEIEVIDPQADTDAMLVDHEMRLTMLELGI